MPKREARLVPPPEPDAPSRNDERNDDACILCGDPIEPWPAEWCELVGAGERTAGFVHVSCDNDYQLFAAQKPIAAVLVTARL